ncbi:hypothetical protein BHM03_00006946 [Ensete ventricosum]|nr:hypothetical protein BHM03_00006946 [Ensete ventricosum]
MRITHYRVKEGEEEGELRTTSSSNGEATAQLLLRHVLRQRSETFTTGEPRDVRHIIGMRTARCRAVPPKIDGRFRSSVAG